MSNLDVTNRFLKCMEQLISDHKVRSRRQFAIALGYHPQGISEMTAQRRDVPLELIEKAVHLFLFNATYLFTGKGPPFLSPTQEHDIHVHQLTIATDEKGNERIIHVPVAAQAGYGGFHDDPVFISELPSYQLPDPQFRSGTYRSFEIAGSSMEPTFRTGDIVIASYVEPRYWTQAIRNGQILVIVTQQNVVIKRVLNKLKSEQVLECCSDNPEFQPYIVPGAQIREVWRVRMRMTTHMDADSPSLSPFEISHQLQVQHRMLENLREQLSQSAPM